MNIDMPVTVVQSGGDVQVDCPYCETLLELRPDHSSQREGFQCSACEGVFEVDWATGDIHYNTDSVETDTTLETVKKIASIGWDIFGALG